MVVMVDGRSRRLCERFGSEAGYVLLHRIASWKSP